MDKFSVCWNGTSIGELAVEKESLHTCFTVRTTLPNDGIWAAWLIGDRGDFRLGILEPEDCLGKIHRRFSDRMIIHLGKVLRCEIRQVRPKQDLWERISNPEQLFQANQLLKELRERNDLLTKRGEGVFWIAVPYDKGKHFSLIEVFCFAEFIIVDGREYVAFCFDRQEQIIFGKSQGSSDCQRLEKNLKT